MRSSVKALLFQESLRHTVASCLPQQRRLCLQISPSEYQLPPSSYPLEVASSNLSPAQRNLTVSCGESPPRPQADHQRVCVPLHPHWHCCSQCWRWRWRWRWPASIESPLALAPSAPLATTVEGNQGRRAGRYSPVYRFLDCPSRVRRKPQQRQYFGARPRESATASAAVPYRLQAMYTLGRF